MLSSILPMIVTVNDVREYNSQVESQTLEDDDLTEVDHHHLATSAAVILSNLTIINGYSF